MSLLLVAGVLAACQPAGVVLSGVVTTTGGHASAGRIPVAVSTSTTADAPTAQTLTDPGGKFSFDKTVLTDGDYVIEIGGNWWTGTGLSADPGDATTVAITASDPVTIDAQVPRAATLTGILVDQTGNPLAGRLISAVEDDQVVATGSTETDGTFDLGLTEPGDVHLAVIDVDAGYLAIPGGSTPATFSPDQGQTIDVGTLTVSTATAIAAGEYSACALLSNGTVKCWGDNQLGELGNGSSISRSDVPVQVTGITDAVAITAGSFSTCALEADGTVWCWGMNYLGALGDGHGDRTMAFSSVPVQVTGITDAIAISASGYRACALHSGGTVSCWGQAVGSAAVGPGQNPWTPIAFNSVPVSISGVTGATAIKASETGTCAATATGSICWGGTTDAAPSAVPDATDMVLGGAENCYLQTTGTVTCRLIGLQNSPDLEPVAGLTGVTALSGSGYMSSFLPNALYVYQAICALTQGTVSCWSGSYAGGMTGSSPTPVPIPTPVPGLTDVTALSASTLQSCALRSNDSVACWNLDVHNTSTGIAVSDTPATVVGIPTVTVTPP